jgi:drug/metabolite transporter (DMT)-like permease
MRIKHFFLAILLTLIYSMCYGMIKAGLAYAPPLRFGGLRILIAGIALLGLAFFRHEPLLPSKARWRGLLVLSLVSTTLVYGAMFLSPGLAGAGIASVLGNFQALITVALAVAVLDERLTTGKVAAVGLGISGVVLIAFPALKASNVESILGIGLALVVSAGTATGNVILKRLRVRQGLPAFAGWQLVLGSLPLLLFSGLIEQGQAITWNMAFGGLLLFMALVETSFPTVAWYWLVQQEDVGRLSLFFFLVPIFGLGFAAMVFNETINLYESVGVVVVLAGIGALIWEASHTPAHAFTYCPFCNTKVAL